MLRIIAKPRPLVFGVAALLSPLSGYTKSLDIPELGIRFSTVPDSATVKALGDRPEGFEGLVQIGTGGIWLYRVYDSVPPGSSIADSAFRSAVLSRKDNLRKPQSKGQPMKLDGNDAWVYLESSRLAPAAPVIFYSCIVYAIVDQHLYRLTATAVTTDGKKPPEFDAEIHALESMTFGPAQRAAPPIPESAASLGDEAPRVVFRSATMLYPPTALRLGKEGAVDVQFQVDAQGRINDPKQTYSDSVYLGEFIPRALQEAVFRVPRDWKEAKFDIRKYTIEFQFGIKKSADSCPPIKEPRVTGATVIAVCE